MSPKPRKVLFYYFTLEHFLQLRLGIKVKLTGEEYFVVVDEKQRHFTSCEVTFPILMIIPVDGIEDINVELQPYNNLGNKSSTV